MFSTVFENQVGLRFSKGRLVQVVGPGVYFLFGRGSKLIQIDTRPRSSYVFGQEVMTKDGGTIKLSLVLSYRVKDAKRYYESSVETEAMDFYTPYSKHSKIENQIEIMARVRLREWAMQRSLRESIDERSALSEWLDPSLTETANEIGIELDRCDLLEFLVTGNLRAAYADLLKAELEGEAALQRARNESATMRSLLNTARLTREHPGLLELRVLTSGVRPRVSFVVGNAPATTSVSEPDSESGP
ncbi:MAG: hypothetical protein HONBIEJF_02304 [Fimbriimonadaceae bacterium]|nr:hypothetical protein [Fimbriimonadaceae bacterium]